MVIGQQRGRDTKENLRRNFGMPAPEGYRKARRLAELASRLAAADRHVRRYEGRRSRASVPKNTRSRRRSRCACASSHSRACRSSRAIIGEGGSGGALALAIADHVLMLEHSTYSVASPEGCAAILWSDAGKAEEAAARLKLTADDLRRFGIVDEIVPEPLGGAHRDAATVVKRVLDALGESLTRLNVLSPEALLEHRYEKYRRLGRMARREDARRGQEMKRRKQQPLNEARRLTVGVIALLIAGLIGVQFARAIGENVVAERELSAIRSDITVLREAARRSAPRAAPATRSTGSDPGHSRALAARAAERGYYFCLAGSRSSTVNDSIGGTVINLNTYGATVRLDGGELAIASAADVEAHRDQYERSLIRSKRLAFELRRQGRRRTVSLAPQIRDDELEEHITSFLKSTEEWESPDGVGAADRHFLRKKRRAELFRSRHEA